MLSIKGLATKDVFDLLASDLQKVEEEFCRQSVSSVHSITDVGQYLHISGGKRLRPALLLLASKLCGYEGPSAIRLGAVVELIHTATLVHDDIIDEAATRRGRPSANVRWGNHVSVLAGDWLYMQAFNVALAERNFKILDVLLVLTQEMVEGEMLQLARLRKIDLTEEDYLELAYRKTACLFSACVRLGAVLAGASERDEERLGSYGINLGLAFQLIDDLLDFTSSEKKLGKPIGNDLRGGKVTLPLIYLLEKCGPEEAAKVSRVLSDQNYNAVQFMEIVEMIQRNGTMRAARDKAYHFAELARNSLEQFQDSPYKQALQSLPDIIVERDS